ncbi:asparaginase domain-containing protein, partial [Selenomonas sp.]|uniref:asparaginase domain-containing protein n=1 Tax=Selenomonas sp. TaxID=2053611 RepID=UPI002A761DD3
MKKKRFCVLATGGTIASRPTPNGLMPTLTGEDLLASVPEFKETCDVDCVQLLQLDSTNVQPEHWILMARAVAERREQYDAFVITHGTDTRAYSAAALSAMLENIDRPVVFTGSQLPAGVPGTDAEQNLLTAFHAALGGRAGVYIAFGGKIIFGDDARKLCTMQLTAFGNINRPLAGRFAGGHLTWLTEAPNVTGAFHLHDQLDPHVAV